MIIPAVPLHPGRARAVSVRLSEPVSFWGGVDQYGTVSDPRHPQYGMDLAGRVLLMSVGRGSSSSSSVLADLIRAGVSPAAIVLAHPDPIIALGVIVAYELDGIAIPVVLVDEARHGALPGEQLVDVTATPSARACTGSLSKTAHLGPVSVRRHQLTEPHRRVRRLWSALGLAEPGFLDLMPRW